MSVAMDLHPGKTRPKPISRKFGPAIPEVKCVSLALQGGSAHGAFTWGVLDRLLEEPRIEVEGVSATSAGAMNAAVMAHGLTTGGRKGAREALEEFWLASRGSALRLVRCSCSRSSRDSCRPISLIRSTTTRCASSSGKSSISSGCGKVRQSSCFCPPPTCVRERSRFSPTRRSPQTVCLHRPVCRSSIKPSRLTASTTGTEAIWATRRYSR